MLTIQAGQMGWLGSVCAILIVWVLCHVALKIDVLAFSVLQVLNICIDIHAVGALDVHEKLLGMASDLGAWPSLDEILNFLPVFAVNVKSYIIKNGYFLDFGLINILGWRYEEYDLLRYWPYMNETKKICRLSLNIFWKDTKDMIRIREQIIIIVKDMRQKSFAFNGQKVELAELRNWQEMTAFLEFDEIFWNYLELFGIIWNFMEFHGIFWNFLDF